MPPISADLKTEKQKGSFAIGYNVGDKLRRQLGAENLDLSAFLLGMQQSISGQKASLSSIEQERAFKGMIGELQQEKMKKTRRGIGDQKKKGEEFQAANKKKKGVTTLPSGLQYLVLKEGNGRRPTATDKVEVHYHGTLVDGTVFDSSVDRGEPGQFAVNQVIPGWTEVLQLMKEGSKWRVVIPSNLAYGQEGRPDIGPNQTLIFEIELLKVK